MGGEPAGEVVRSLQLPVFGQTRTNEEGQTRASEEGQASGADPHAGTPVTGTKGGEAGEVAPFVLSEALPVVSGKLVRRILKAEYIDMAELLKDNMEAERRRCATEGAPPGATSRSARREIPDVLSWLQCFTLYTAVVVSRHPEKIKELLAYQAMIISEARRCGGRGWLLYDAAFRQQMTSFEAVDFGRINQSLYSTTFLAYGGGRTKACTECMMADHAREECALHPNRSLPVVQLKEAGRAATRESWRAPRELERPSEKKRRVRRGVCFAFNEGVCKFGPDCRFDHQCTVCKVYGDHGAAQCKEEGGRRRGQQ